MKRLVYTICFSLMVFGCALAMQNDAREGGILVVSDMDDTIKISNVRDKLEMISFSVFKDSLFYGMNTVYQAIAAKNPDASFHYVSNGWKPTVKETHTAILEDFNFPQADNYYPRSLKKIINKYPHKFNTIVSLAKLHHPRLVILIGDNGESDPEVYREVSIELKEYFASIGKSVEVLTYIHTVYDSNPATSGLPRGQVGFGNAGILGNALASQGVITAEMAKSIAVDVNNKILNEGKNRVYGPLVSPYFKAQNKPTNKTMCRAFYSF